MWPSFFSHPTYFCGRKIIKWQLLLWVGRNSLSSKSVRFLLTVIQFFFSLCTLCSYRGRGKPFGQSRWSSTRQPSWAPQSCFLILTFKTSSVSPSTVYCNYIKKSLSLSVLRQITFWRPEKKVFVAQTGVRRAFGACLMIY